MKKDFSSFYTKLAVLAGIGLGVSVWLHPEVFSPAKVLCYFYIVLTFIFFRMDLDNVKEKADFQVANWFALLGVEADILLGLNFWLLPLAATVVVSAYFLIRAWVWRKHISHMNLRKNAIWITAFNYATVAFVVYILAPVCRMFIRIVT